MPSDFDWRIGMIDREPIFCCKYYMAKGHWQILDKNQKGDDQFGNFETWPLAACPPDVLKTAIRVGNLIGDGLYGVDLKEIDGKAYVIEINDNPNIEAGIEDEILGRRVVPQDHACVPQEIGESRAMSYHLFERFGVELEYMVVDRDSLAVKPVVDRLLQAAAKLPGAKVESESEPGWPDEVSLGPISLSNELTAHVLEFKATEPTPQLHGVSSLFADAIKKITPLLEKENCVLLPGGMHPTMDPFKEMHLWPHGNSEVYEAFNKIFDCRGHGWANLQSCHLNLPFGVNDVENESGEFGRLHAAIRAILPILPALSSASPIMDAKVTGLMDNRLEVYRTNSKKIPQGAGKVIPERVFTKSAYDREIFQKIYEAYKPYDPEGVLRYEWANSRGCIARFMRNAIEIRVLDVQEAPRVDLAICSAITCVLKAMCEDRGFDQAALRSLEVDPLHAVLARMHQGRRTCASARCGLSESDRRERRGQRR
jgi:carboxylate-amine ligase